MHREIARNNGARIIADPSIACFGKSGTAISVIRGQGFQ
jgi:hypothetical protein